MNIAIDASRTTVSRLTGTETYALHLINAILAQQSKHHFHLFFRDVPQADLFPQTNNYTQHIIPFKRLWTHLRFATALWATSYDVVWVPAHTLPRFFPTKAVVTIHDLGYLHFPEAHADKDRQYLDWSTRYSARRANHVLADSMATKADLIHHYNISSEKITVVYPGINPALKPTPLANRVRERYKLPERYLLFIGTLQPRKNIERLVQAFDQWRQASDQKDMMLALGGKAGWLFDPAWVKGVANVQQLGYIADDDLAALYSEAWGYVMPSLYEGFGFPILEAMRCETPVLCSNTSSMPELAGDAAILVDPLDVNSIAHGIYQLVEETERRQKLVENGKKQVQHFTWEQAAQQTLQILTLAAQ